MSCHTDPTTTRTSDGKPVLVDDKKWKTSIHADTSVACVDCHADLAGAEMPHAEKLKPAQCGSCHEKAVPEFTKGVHSKTRSDRKGPNATCFDCHGKPHEILASGDRSSMTHHLNQIETCAKCHDDPKLIEKEMVPGGVVQNFVDSIHGRGLKKSGLTVAPTCSSCHGTHEIRTKDDPASSARGMNQVAMCGKCHEGIAEKYELSVHAAQVKKQGGKTLQPGDQEAPTCSSCHTAHQIKRTDLPAWELGVTEECGTCHKESMTTYSDAYHGFVNELGFTRVAKCADCHGSHDIVGKEDPKSRVVGDNRLETCRSCHEGAPASFADYDPHADKSDKERSAIVYYVALAMQLLLAGVMGFFGIHTLLWFARILIERAKERREARMKGGAR